MSDRKLQSVPHAVHGPPCPPLSAAVEAGSSTQADFSGLVREHSGYVLRVLRCLGVRDADVEDLCQEIFVVVHRKLPSYEPRGALRSWIYGIALRVVSDYRKRAHRKRETLSESVPELRVPAEQESALERQQDWQLLDRLTSGLSEEQRQVFVLFEIEALPMREVSAIVGCPLQTAYSRLQVARQHLAAQLARLRAEGGLP
jgi:RNA polymerase sigma-70 factor (ECF subfamily)